MATPKKTTPKEAEIPKELTASEFYESVKKTDPNFVKNQTVGGRKITTIDPQFQTENATKAFNGLYGANWGIKDISFTTRTYPNGEKAPTEVMTLRGTFYYPSGEFPYSVSDKSFYISNSNKSMIDTDIEKKLLTSFKSKCLSLLGFNADIFLGQFDNAQYVDEVSAEFTFISQSQFQDIMKLMQDSDTVAGDFNKAFHINKTTELPVSEFNKAIAMLNAKLAKIKREAKAEPKQDESQQ